MPTIPIATETVLDEINDFYQKGSGNDGVRESKHFMTTRLLTKASWHIYTIQRKTVKCRRQTSPRPRIGSMRCDCQFHI